MTHENYKKIMMFAFFSFLTIALISSETEITRLN